ncbi:unnamed protein product [Rodentolepis nana]|uniref:Uncharacterized protein n=1 Tax=Rodentolepis nana TaxID=102285 RepID=A0A0R3TKY8_RODNA|nr:unnamed protein product [Rodentolepis nana]
MRHSVTDSANANIYFQAFALNNGAYQDLYTATQCPYQRRLLTSIRPRKRLAILTPIPKNIMITQLTYLYPIPLSTAQAYQLLWRSTALAPTNSRRKRHTLCLQESSVN